MLLNPTGQLKRRDAALGALVFVFLVTVYSLTYSGILTSGDEALYVSTAISRGAWGISDSAAAYGGYGLTYSVEPAQSFVGAVLYRLAQAAQVGTVHALFLTNVFATALTGVLVYGLIRHQGYSYRTATLGALVFGLGTMAWPISKTYFRDPPAVMVGVAAVWSFEAVFMRRSWAAQIGQWGLTILAMACAVLFKNTAAALLLAILVATLARAAFPAVDGERRAALIGTAGLGFLGSITLLVPTTGILARFSFQNYLNTLLLGGHANLASVRDYLLPLAAMVMSPGKGLFVEAPALLLALAALPRQLKRGWRQLVVPWLTLLGLIAMTARYQGLQWYGGTGWGVRYLLPAVPLLVVAAAPILESLLTTSARCAKAAIYGLILLSFLFQLGSVSALPEDYYGWLNLISPSAAWTFAIWNPLYAEVTGFWRMILQGRPWDFAWVRLFGVNPVPVVVVVASLVILLALGLAVMQSLLANPPGKRLMWGIGVLAIATVTVFPYEMLRAYYPDPYFHENWADFRMAADYVAQNVRPGDAIAIRDIGHPLWFYFLNYAYTPVPWYSLTSLAIDDSQIAGIQADLAPVRGLDPSTVELFSHILPARYSRVWVLNDYNAGGGNLKLNEWWLSQIAAPVKTEVVYGGGGAIGLSLFAFTPATGANWQPAGYQFDDGVRLSQFALLPFAGKTAYHAGDVVPVRLTWDVTQRPKADYTVTIQLLDTAGGLQAQQDGLAGFGFRPTSGWLPGQSIADNHGLLLPADLPAGDYQLAVGLYDLRTGIRLPVTGPGGPSDDDLAHLAEIQIQAR